MYLRLGAFIEIPPQLLLHVCGRGLLDEGVFGVGWSFARPLKTNAKQASGRCRIRKG